MSNSLGELFWHRSERFMLRLYSGKKNAEKGSCRVYDLAHERCRRPILKRGEARKDCVLILRHDDREPRILRRHSGFPQWCRTNIKVQHFLEAVNGLAWAASPLVHPQGLSPCTP